MTLHIGQRETYDNTVVLETALPRDISSNPTGFKHSLEEFKSGLKELQEASAIAWQQSEGEHQEFFEMVDKTTKQAIKAIDHVTHVSQLKFITPLALMLQTVNTLANNPDLRLSVPEEMSIPILDQLSELKKATSKVLPIVQQLSKQAREFDHASTTLEFVVVGTTEDVNEFQDLVLGKAKEIISEHQDQLAEEYDYIVIKDSEDRTVRLMPPGGGHLDIIEAPKVLDDIR